MITKKYLYKNWKKGLLLILILLPFSFNRTHSISFDINSDALSIGIILKKYMPLSVLDSIDTRFGYRKYSLRLDDYDERNKKNKYLLLSQNHFIFRKNIIDVDELKNVEGEKIAAIEYMSHVGISAHFYNFLYNQLENTFKLKNMPFRQKIFLLKFFQSVLFTIVIALICFFVYKQYGINWLIAFGLPLLFSAYIPKFANHLGLGLTIGFFVPLLLSVLSVRYQKYLLYILPAYLLIFMLKSLNGYEFMPTIMLSGIFFPVFHFFNEKKKKDKIKYLKIIFWIGLFSFMGFLIAFLYHASIRGETTSEGIKNIVVEDGMRRTFNTSFTDSKNNLSFIFKSIFKFFALSWFYHPLFYGLIGFFLFPLMLFFTLKIKIGEYKKNKSVLTIIEPFFFIFIGLSWILLAFNHAYIHYDLMTNIIWFFGPIQYFIYIILSHYKILEKIKKIIQ